VGNACVLFVCLEAMIDLSRYRSIMRSDSPFGNSKEYERDAVTDATLELLKINTTVGIAYSRAL
jgi:hypothetical protein